MSTLQARLNDPEYRFWVKAGICLLYIKEGLEDFVTNTSLQFHQNVLANLTRSAIANTGQPVCGVNINRRRLVTVCQHPYCQMFLNAVIQEGLDPNQPFTLKHANLANSDVNLWHSHPYELAKLFMNAGQTAAQTGPAQTDLSGLVNFIGHCKIPCSQISSRRLIEEVRSARNDIMHTSDFKLTEGDFRSYSKSMVNLLNDVNISVSPRAQHAVAQIQGVTNAADFTITLEDEGKLIHSLTDELHILTVEIKQKLVDVEEGVERENSEIRSDMQHVEEEMRKVNKLYITLQQRVDASSDLRNQMGNQLRKLEELLKGTIREYTQRIEQVERQQKETYLVVHKLQAQQKTYQTQTSQAIENVTQLQETYQTQTNESIENIKTKHEELERKTGEAIGDIRKKAGQTWVPSEQDKSQLRQYLIDGYKDKLDVILLPDWEPLHVSGIFTPAILICGREKETQEKKKFRNLGTYRELFYENGVLQKRVILLGEAGAGKTTFSKHLTDLWCEPRTQQQFADVTVIKEFRYFFYVSCRFAKEGDIIADMIKDQIFGDDKLKAVATYMLEHYPECCLILLDGADEWKGSPTSDTGRRGDIAGLPGMEGVEHCVILITSRPWRFDSLPTRSQSIFRCLQINGIQDVQVLADRILQKLEYPDPAESSYEFLRQVSQNNMYELMKTPMILIIALGGWVNDKSFHKSMCINYINMIQSFIRRSKGQAGWSSSKSKLQQLIPNLETLETGWETKANELPHLLLRYKSIRRYAGLCLLLGELAFDLLLGKEEQSLVFSKKVLKSYLPADDENDESVNVCLALGILSKAETPTRGLRKLESYAFCHKTFQEFFAALWLASKYSNEKSKLYKCLKSYRDLMSYEILISFLCGFDPEAGKRFWVFVSEAVEIVDEDDKDAIERERKVKDVTDLVSKCMKEHGFDQKGQMSDQLYFCIPHIVVYNNTSNEDIMLLCHVMEEYPCSLKSLCVKYCQTLCSGLQKLKLSHLPSVNENSDSLISSVQKHNKRKKRRLFYCLCCLSSTSKNSDSENSDSEHRHSHENLPSVSEHRDSEHSESEHSDSEHSDSLSSPVLDLQKHDKLETLWLQHISIEGLLLPVEGARITSLELRNVTMSHHGREQLSESLSSCSHLEDLYLTMVRCREHMGSCCIPVLALQKHDKLKKLWLSDIYIEGLLLPVEGARITSLTLDDVTMSHHGCEQLSESLSSCSYLEDLDLDGVGCREHRDSCCLPVLDLQKHDKLKTLWLKSLSIEGLLLPVEGARITSLKLYNVTMSHHGCEQLSGSLSSGSSLEDLCLDGVGCREHRDSCCLPVLDLQKHDKLKTLWLKSLSIEGLLLPVEGARITSLNLYNVTMSHHGCEQLSGSLSSSSCLEYLCLERVRCREHSDSCCIPVLDLQKHDKLKTLRLCSLSIEGLLLPVEGARITSLKLYNVTMTHHGCEQLSGSLSSGSSLEYLDLYEVRCREHRDSCCILVLALQKHDKLKTLALRSLSIEGLLLPVEGARITSLSLDNVTMPHHDWEQLSGSLSSGSFLEYLRLERVRCREHRDSCCIPVLDLQKHNKLKKLALQSLSIEGLRLPVEGARITSLRLYDVTMPHHGCEQLPGSVTSCSHLEDLRLERVSCREHRDSDSDSCCILVLALQKHDKLKALDLQDMSIEGLLLPVEGARITSLRLSYVTMPHHSCEQLSADFSSRPEQENWDPFERFSRRKFPD